MVQRMLIGVVLCALAMVVVRPARADVVVFADDFEADPVANGVTALIHWAVTGNVDVVAAGDKCLAAGGTSRCLDLDGTGSGVAPAITTRAALLLLPGLYELSFDLAGSQAGPEPNSDNPNAVQVTLGALAAETFGVADTAAFAPVTIQVPVATTTTATLAFTHVGAVDNRGLLLDNVRLARLQTRPAVPAGGFAGDVASCQHAIGREIRKLVQKVVNRHVKCLQDEAKGKVCDAGKRDAAIVADADKARGALDKACGAAEYAALGHVGDPALTRERLVVTTLDAAAALIGAGYVADYATLP